MTAARSAVWERWHVYDTLTGEWVGAASFYSEAGARVSIADTKRAVRMGHRPDLADVVDRLDVKRRPPGD